MLQSLTFRRTDGTLVGQVNGLPYHIIQSDSLWPVAQAIAANMGDELPFEPAPPPPEPPAVPSQITNFQARALLMQMPGSAEGRTLFQDVDETLQQLGGVAYQAWEYTTIFPRDSELIATMAAQFNLTNAQLDEMFIAAAQISV